MILTLITIRNISWAINQHITIIYEGSCDSEDWNFSFALRHSNKNITKYIEIENIYFVL